jgi:Spy/CpxP family protein refolding chaperone
MDPAETLLEASRGQPLSAGQRAIVGQLEGELVRYQSVVPAAFHTLQTELADQVRAGAIDRAAVQAGVNAAASTVVAYADREADVIDALHASLNPVQRAGVISAVRLTQPGQAEAQGPARSPETMRQKRLAWLTRELMLDPAQQQRTAAILEAQPPLPNPMRERQARFDALLAGFVNDTFDAHAIVAAAPSPSEVMRAYAEREVEFLSKLLPILRPEQREQLASVMQSSRTTTDHEDSGGDQSGP